MTERRSGNMYSTIVVHCFARHFSRLRSVDVPFAHPLWQADISYIYFARCNETSNNNKKRQQIAYDALKHIYSVCHFLAPRTPQRSCATHFHLLFACFAFRRAPREHEREQNKQHQRPVYRISIIIHSFFYANEFWWAHAILLITVNANCRRVHNARLFPIQMWPKEIAAHRMQSARPVRRAFAFVFGQQFDRHGMRRKANTPLITCIIFAFSIHAIITHGK